MRPHDQDLCELLVEYIVGLPLFVNDSHGTKRQGAEDSNKAADLFTPRDLIPHVEIELHVFLNKQAKNAEFLVFGDEFVSWFLYHSFRIY